MSASTSVPPPVTIAGTWRDLLGLKDDRLVKARALGGPSTNNVDTRSQKDPKLLVPGFSRQALFQHVDVEFRSELSNRGGGRGFFAIKNIPPGELILSEIPCADIPDDPVGRDPAERCLLNLASGRVKVEKARQVLKDLLLLHPRILDRDVDPDRLKTLRQDYAGLLKEIALLPLGKALELHVESVLLRAVCALHFNGFVTGVYLHLAMVNHSCAPNCVKWGVRDGVQHSEVRAIREIKSGEEITFAYLVPHLRSREARQRALRGQFSFDCTCELCVRGDVFLEQGAKQAIDELEQLLESVEEKNELTLDARTTLQKVSRARNQARMQGAGVRSLSLAHADLITADACLALLDDNRVQKPKDEQMLVLTLLSRSLSVRKTQLVLFRVGVPEGPDAERIRVEETRSEAEVTLQHIGNSIGYFASQGKAGEKVLCGLRDDDTGEQIFANRKDAIDCQLACDKACRAIADLYEEYQF